MRCHALALATCLLAACTQGAAPQAPADPGTMPSTASERTSMPDAPVTAALIPARFVGTWAAGAAACAAVGDPSRLVIAADRLRFHESSGPLRSVSVNGDDLSLTAALTGEGETREATYRFMLSDGDTVLTDRDAGMVRRRCGA
jgi:hypothetical protein